MSANHVIFIPGFMCDHRLFAPQSEWLSNQNVSFHIEAPIKGNSIADFAQDILSTAPESFALCGLSMGGIIALEIYKQAPERVTHMALLNTTPFADRSRPQRHEHIARAQQGEMLSIISEDLKPKYLAPAYQDSTILRQVVKMAEALGEAAFVRQSLALLYRKHYLNLLPSIVCPTLVLTGQQDGVCGPDIATYMADNISGSRFATVENCGHLSTLEQPDIVNKELATLLGIKTNHKEGVIA